jgi:hypothetical protein
VSVKELMANMIDPISDNVFDAVWWESDLNGFREHKPQTDEDWEKIRIGAVTLAEGIFLLKVPRPFAPEGDVNNSAGPNASELSPDQIQALVDKDPVLWDARIQAIRNVALATLEAVEMRDSQAVFQAATDLDEACEGCHIKFWYPGDQPQVERFAKSRLYNARNPAKSLSPATPDGR